MFLSIQSKCKDVYVLSGLCQDDIKNWWFCRWGQLEICTWNCTLWPEFLCQMVKGTCLFLSGYQFMSGVFPQFSLTPGLLIKNISPGSKIICCKWWQKPWSWQGCRSPYQMLQAFFNFIVFLFSSQFEFQKFGTLMLEEFHSVFLFFLEILVTDQCTCFVKCNYVLYKELSRYVLRCPVLWKVVYWAV